MSSLADLVESLAQVGGQDPGDALSLPPQAYTSSELLALETQEIFRKEWICVGRGDEIPQACDYFTTQVDTTPIIVVRNKDGDVTVLTNVCRHRLTVIASGAGNAEYFSCPYHGWTYDTEGQLLTAPRMPETFDISNCRLPTIRSELWNGFIYVNLDDDAEPLAPRLSGLDELFANFHVERMRTVAHTHHRWNTKWKVLVENFLEVYHIQLVHPETLYRYGSHDRIDMLAGTPAYHFYRQNLNDDVETPPLDPAFAIDNPDLNADDYRAAYVGGVFPTHVFSVVYNWVFWLALQPEGTGQVKIECGVAGPVNLPLNGPDHPSFPYPGLVEVVNEEDRIRVEAVQRGAESGFGAQGRLHQHEGTIISFARYLGARLDRG